MPINQSQRVVFYIDGYNFYNGLKANNWKQFYWLDMTNFCRALIRPGHTLVAVNYFSAPPLNHSSKENRQEKFFKVNSIHPEFSLHLSKHTPKNRTCKQCGYTMIGSEEKQTDVKIACEILKNSANAFCELSVVVSGDSDLIPAIQVAKEINPGHQVMVFFPPKRITHQIKKHADGCRDLSQFKKAFKDNIFPDSVNVQGTNITIPAKWKAYQP